MGDPDDITDFELYNAIKTSVLSGGVNHIDTAPNYRYMKSEKTVGKALTVLENKYDIKRDQLFVTSKGGYVPENADDG
jgi:aryl-alcohol dehydrogenase-like predicted oxidoreductase